MLRALPLLVILGPELAACTPLDPEAAAADMPVFHGCGMDVLSEQGTVARRHRYYYDDDGHRIVEDQSQSDGVVDVHIVHEYEDDLLMATQTERGDGEILSTGIYRYDPAGRLILDSLDYWGDGDIEVTTAFTYDDQGDLATATRTSLLTVPTPTTWVTRYEHRDHRMTRAVETVDGEVRLVTAWQYNGAGARVYERQNATAYDKETTWRRDEAGRVVARTEEWIGVPGWRDYQFAYDEEGRVVSGEFFGWQEPALRWQFHYDCP